MSPFPARSGPAGTSCSLFCVTSNGPPRLSFQAASDPNEICSNCHLTYLTHVPILVPSDVNYALRRGNCLRTLCGGYFSMKSVWTREGRCICSATWEEHSEPRVDWEAPQTSSVNPPPQGTSSSNVAPALASTTLAITRFQGVPGPTSRVENAARLAAQLPIPAVARHVGARSRPTPMAIVASASEASRASQRGGGAGNASRGRGRGGAAPPATATGDIIITFVLWPVVTPNTPGFSNKAEQTYSLRARYDYCRPLLDFFIGEHLALDVAVPRNGPISLEGLTVRLREHLAAHDLRFAPAPASSSAPEVSGQYLHQPYLVLQSGVKAGVYVWHPHTKMNENLFTAAALKKLDDAVPHPDMGSGKLLVFLGMRFAALQGDVERFAVPDEYLVGMHPCWGLRVLALLPDVNGTRPPDGVDRCIEGCPEDDPPLEDVTDEDDMIPDLNPLRTPSPNLVHLPPSPPRARPAQRPRVTSPVPYVEDQPDFDWTIPELEDDPATDHLDNTASMIRDFLGWTVTIAARLSPSLDDFAVGPTINIRAPTAPAAGAAVNALILQDLQAAVRNTERPFPLSSWFNSLKNVDIGPSYGAGPLLAAMNAALVNATGTGGLYEQVPASEMFLSPLILPSGPVWSPMASDPDRLDQYIAHGRLLAIYIINHRQAPFPFSIWLLLVMLDGRNALATLRPETIKFFDRELWDQLNLQCVFDAVDAPMPPMQNAQLRTFIIDVLGVQPSSLANLQDPINRANWYTTALGKALLGDASFHIKEEFTALREGFNLALGRGERLFDTIHAQWPASSLPPLVYIYDREIKSVLEVTKLFLFTIAADSEHTDGTTQTFARIFKWRLHRYLNGRGHPATVDGYVDTAQLQKYAGDVESPLFRAKLLFYVMTESKRLFAGSEWRLTFRFFGRARAIAGSNAAGRPLNFHTCSQSCDVVLDEPLEKALLERPDADTNAASAFDAWLHLQLIDSEQYNQDGTIRSPTLSLFRPQCLRQMLGADAAEDGHAAAVVALPFFEPRAAGCRNYQQPSFAQQAHEMEQRRRAAAAEAAAARAPPVAAPPPASAAAESSDDENEIEIIEQQHRSPARRRRMHNGHSFHLPGTDSDPESPLPFSPFMQDAGSMVFYVNIHFPDCRKTFVEVIPAGPIDARLFHVLAGAAPDLAVQLDLARHRDDTMIAFLKVPIPASQDYMGLASGFHVLGSMQDVETLNSDILERQLFPAPPSSAAERVIQQRALPGTTPVYVICVYDKLANSRSSGPAPVPVPTSTTSDSTPAEAPDNDDTDAALDATHTNTVVGYITSKYPLLMARVAKVRSAGYGRVYCAFILLCAFDTLCHNFSLKFPVPPAADMPGYNATVQWEGESLTICANDIIDALGQTRKTFKNHRSIYRKASRLRQPLQQYVRTAGTGSTPLLPREQHERIVQWLPVLNVLLRGEKVQEVPVEGAVGPATEAARMNNWTTLRNDIEVAKKIFAPRPGQASSGAGDDQDEDDDDEHH
ncbi:hypothetical protein MKEN_00203000 [Mycena kentingensis (nom. inval.)]|nr:hypothetical protein MKEN_00203000 [Mycena kentingensis (nom. inval.)]